MVVLSLFTATALAKFSEPNMNGDVYRYASTPGADASKKNFPINWRDRPAEDDVEYIDLYSGKISTLYGQVFYHPLPEVKLPEELIERFDGKIMAIYGWEWDQVYRTEKGDEPVPMSVAYNHHSLLDIYGKTVEVETITAVGENDSRVGKGNYHAKPYKGEKVKVVKENTNSIDIKKDPWAWVPSHVQLGVGAESRDSSFATHPGYADLVRSPNRYSITAMQIDTWNRDKMSKTYPTEFVPGPYPKGTKAPRDAGYSGILECPMTTRVKKIIDASYDMQTTGDPCAHKLLTKDECFSAAERVVDMAKKNSVVNNRENPSGCSVVITGSAQSGMVAEVVWNDNENAWASCGEKGGAKEAMGYAETDIDVTLSLTVEKPTEANGKSEVTIVLSGPADKWFAIGFGAQVMAQSPYTIVVEPEKVSERKLADHNPGTPLASTISVVSNTVTDGVRTVEIRRDAQVTGMDYFPFTTTMEGFQFIAAKGFSGTFGYHQAKVSDSIKLLPSEKSSPGCICADSPKAFGQATGKLQYMDEAPVGFTNKCYPKPYGSILDDKNPTCDIRYYEGGLNACHDGWFLLDADQEIPWQDQPLEYELKMRLYFSEFKSWYHKPYGNLFWGLGSLIENDVPQAAPGTPVEEAVYITEGVYKFRRNPGDPAQKAWRITSHFHASSAIALEVWTWDEEKQEKGRLLCNNTARAGQGRADVPYDEKHYIAIDYCYFSDNPEFGLEPMPDMTDKSLYYKKIHNSTYGHTGEMSITTISTHMDYTVIEDHELETEHDRIKVALLSGRSLTAPPKHAAAE